MSAGTGAFTTWWSSRYTHGLPAEVRDRRRDEIACDVFEQRRAASDESDARPTSVTWRTVRGIPADVAWRRQEMRAMRANSPVPPESHLRSAWSVVTQRWFAPFAVLLIVFNLLFAWAVITEDGAKLPGQAIGPVLLVLCAAAITLGLWMRWRAAREIAQRVAAPGEPLRVVGTSTIAVLLGVLAVTLVLLLVGVSTGRPVVFFAALAIFVGSAAFFGGRAVVRALSSSDLASRVGLADGLIIAGTFPALMMFWMLVPPILALLVIGGTLGTSPKVRPAA